MAGMANLIICRGCALFRRLTNFINGRFIWKLTASNRAEFASVDSGPQLNLEIRVKRCLSEG